MSHTNHNPANVPEEVSATVDEVLADEGKDTAARAPAPTVDEEIARQANDGTLGDSMAGKDGVK